MIITYYGASCFKIQAGERVVAFNPPSKKSAFKPPRFQADIVLISNDHPDYNGYENIAGKEKDGQPFLVKGPGEYEINGIEIAGAAVPSSNIYVVKLEDITMAQLSGLFSEKELKPEIREFLSGIDVLFTPAAPALSKIIKQVKPKIIIPSHHNKKMSDFLEEFSSDKIEPLEKYTFRKKDILDKNQEVVILKPLL